MYKSKPTENFYIRSMGKALRVTAIFESDEEANKYMSSHRDQGVVSQFGPYIFIASLYEMGDTFKDKLAEKTRCPVTDY